MTSQDHLTLDRTFVVDCDVHIDDSPRALAPYSDQPWRRALEEMGQGPQTYLRIPGYNVLPESGFEAMSPRFPRPSHTRRVESPEQMIQELGDLSIDAAILFPDYLLALAALPAADYAAALARAYNKWIVDVWLADRRQLYGALVAAPQAPSEAANEIRRYGSHPKVVAVYLPTSAVYPLWGNRVYDPIFEAAQDAGLPVMLHSVGGVHPHFPFNVEQFDTQLARHTVAHTFAMMANAISMVSTGVPVRFPSLDVVFTEAGVSWAPFIEWRLDKEYNEKRRELPFYGDRPSQYMKRMHFATQPIEEPVRRKDLVTLMGLFDGEDRVLFASDWPHHDFDHPRQLFDLPMPPDMKRKVMGENAAKLFGIPTTQHDG